MNEELARKIKEIREFCAENGFHGLAIISDTDTVRMTCGGGMNMLSQP